MRLPGKLKSLSDRPLDKTVWEGNIFRDYYIASDAKILIDVTCVVGPKIKQAEKLFRRKHKRDYQPEVADKLIDDVLKTEPIAAVELGWSTVKSRNLKSDVVDFDALWIVSEDKKLRVPIMADYARLILEFTGYDTVAIMGIGYGDPVGFFRQGELAALCAPLRDVEVKRAA